jgi:phosphatidylethanolamine/phosphatidyl-N-methylethanolamine N-methyltransferase
MSDIGDDFYKNHYQEVLNTGIVGVVSNITHKQLEKPFDANRYFSKVLELGAGHGQHLKFVKHGFEEYFESDLRIGNLPNRGRPNINQIELDAADLSIFPDATFDRIIATCLLIHLPDPESAIKQWRAKAVSGGFISIYVPCEPGIVLRALRYITTQRKSSKMGLKHYSQHYREHITYFSRIHLLINETFSEDKIGFSYFPLKLHSWNLNLWVIYQIQIH